MLCAEVLDESAWDGGRVLEARNAEAFLEDRLRALLRGTGDYRDNYTAGYSLWLLLTTCGGFENMPVVWPESTAVTGSPPLL